MAEDTQARAPAQQREEIQDEVERQVGQIPSSATPTFVGQSTTQRLGRRREETRAAAQAAASIPAAFQYDLATAPLVVGPFVLLPTTWVAIYERIRSDTVRELTWQRVPTHKIHIECSVAEQRLLVSAVAQAAVDAGVQPGGIAVVNDRLVQLMMVPFHDQAEAVFPQYGIAATVVRDHCYCNDTQQRTDASETLKLMGVAIHDVGH